MSEQLLSETERSERFHQALDRILLEGGEPDEDFSREDRQALQLAQRWLQADFSSQSKLRGALRHRLSQIAAGQANQPARRRSRLGVFQSFPRVFVWLGLALGFALILRLVLLPSGPGLNTPTPQTTANLFLTTAPASISPTFGTLTQTLAVRWVPVSTPGATAEVAGAPLARVSPVRAGPPLLKPVQNPAIIFSQTPAANRLPTLRIP